MDGQGLLSIYIFIFTCLCLYSPSKSETVTVSLLQCLFQCAIDSGSTDVELKPDVLFLLGYALHAGSLVIKDPMKLLEALSFASVVKLMQ